MLIHISRLGTHEKGAKDDLPKEQDFTIAQDAVFVHDEYRWFNMHTFRFKQPNKQKNKKDTNLKSALNLKQKLKDISSVPRAEVERRNYFTTLPWSRFSTRNFSTCKFDDKFWITLIFVSSCRGQYSLTQGQNWSALIGTLKNSGLNNISTLAFFKEMQHIVCSFAFYTNSFHLPDRRWKWVMLSVTWKADKELWWVTHLKDHDYGRQCRNFCHHPCFRFLSSYLSLWS